MTRERGSRACDYCGLVFSGAGYSPDGMRHFCCSGCYLVQKIVGASGEEGIASWIIIRLGIGAFLAMNVMMISLVLYTVSPRELGSSTVQALRWAMVVLSSPAMLILGAPFVLGAVRDLRRMRLSTDALIATGSTAAFGVSTAHTVIGRGHVYFDTAAMLLLIVTLGRLLEAAAKNSTSRAIRELADLIPQTARVRRDGREVEIPSEQVRVGDMMVVRPGERIPADGQIQSGECLIEEGAFTGESCPCACRPGDFVYGGSVNCDGFIIVRADAALSDSLLSQIAEMVRRAGLEKASVERIAERVSSVFVPAVWLIALIAGVYWGLLKGDVERAGLSSLAVLVVACPCALGLATPMATCLAIGRAASVGVIIRSGEIIERLSAVRRIFFDKTGTLTTGRLAVCSIRTDPSVSADEVLLWAASLEQGSEHSIAEALVRAAAERGLELGAVEDFRVFPGKGVAGLVMVNGVRRPVTVGSKELLLDGHDCPEDLLRSSDLTTIYIGWEGRVRAVMNLFDHARPEAEAAIRELLDMGISVGVISGDKELPVRRLAEQMGIQEIFPECTPPEKVELISKFSRPHAMISGSDPQDRCGADSSDASAPDGAVVMVGDGINDAPALRAADIGIAIGGGTDLAREASDITLIGDDITRIPWIISLSRKSCHIIRQNLYWAFGYNSVAIALAFAGFLHPLIAAGAMLGSSMAVIGNSMRIRGSV